MPHRTKLEVLNAIRNDGIVPVFYHGDPTTTQEVARSLHAGGLNTIEYTNRGAGAVRVFAELVDMAARDLPDLIVGVGSVVDAATAAAYIDLGASFVVGPSFDAETARACNRRNVAYVPGCGTVTEIQTAYEHGASYVKLFPAGSVGGPSFLSAVRGPCPWVEAIPTGGVEPTVDSLSAWFTAGAPAVGMGSKLFPKDLVGEGDWEGVQQKVAEAVAAAAEAKAR